MDEARTAVIERYEVRKGRVRGEWWLYGYTAAGIQIRMGGFDRKWRATAYGERQVGATWRAHTAEGIVYAWSRVDSFCSAVRAVGR
jgi:hypothetical protein